MKGVVKSIICCVVTLAVSCVESGGGLCSLGNRGEQPNAKTEQRVRLLFAGDAMCHSPQIAAARQADGSLDFSESFVAMKPYFERADISVVNLETTISPNTTYSGYPMFSSPKEYAEALAQVGVDVALLANNHCCDRGARGIRTTIETLNRLGVAHTGVFADGDDYKQNRILRLDTNGIKFSILNYTYGTNGMPVPSGCVVNLIDTMRITEDLRIAREGADCVVAYLHWGDEYQSRPSRGQRRLADFLHRHGADVVVGSHPHVVQPARATNGRVTIFSLGNFVSNQRKRYCDGGVVAEVEVVKSADGECRYDLTITPVWVALPEYKIMPPEVAAMENMSDAQHAMYEQFMSDTERLFVAGLN